MFWENIPLWLSGAEDEAGDVVGLAGGAYEIFDAFHQEFESLLRVQIGEAADDIEPAIVTPPLECRRIERWKIEISSARLGRFGRPFSAL